MTCQAKSKRLSCIKYFNPLLLFQRWLQIITLQSLILFLCAPFWKCQEVFWASVDRRDFYLMLPDNIFLSNQSEARRETWIVTECQMTWNVRFCLFLKNWASRKHNDYLETTESRYGPPISGISYRRTTVWNSSVGGASPQVSHCGSQ